MPTVHHTVANMSEADAEQVIEALQERLVATLDLQLTLKHVHWNVVGMNFIAVHEMIDPQVDEVRLMSDALAERIATLGGAPQGTPGAIERIRSWDDYSIDRATTREHLEALDAVYDGVVGDHRNAQKLLADLDPVSEDMIIGQLAQLELFQWFLRSHLMDGSGTVQHQG